MVYLFICLLVFLFFYYRKRFLSLSFLFVFIYIIVGISIYYLYSENLYVIKNTIGFYLFIASYLVPVIPIILFNEKKLSYLKVPIDNFSISIFKIICIGSLISLLYYLTAAIKVLGGNFAESRNLIYEGGSPFLGVLNFILAFFALCYPLNIIGFFYGLTSNFEFYKKYKWFFLLGSFSYIIRVLAFAGRDGPVFWGFIFFGLLAIFKPFIQQKDMLRIKKGTIIFLSLSLVLLALITISRFENYYDNPFISVFDYLGQSSFNFAGLFNSAIEPELGKINFSLPFKLLGFDLISQDRLNMNMEYYGLLGYMFYGSIGSLFLDFGNLIFILYLFILPIITHFILRRRFLNLNYIVYIIIFIHLFLHGIFYFNLKSLEGNVFILLLFIIMVIKQNKTKILLRQLHSK